jgi:HSP20 family protein
MTLMRFDPFREWDRLTEQLGSNTRMSRTMPMEAFRRGDEFVVALDLPGVSPDDVEVTVERNVVSIRARRQVLRSDGDEVIVDERPQGEFTRQLFLGDNLESGKMQANFDRGVLTLTIPVAEKSKARRIQIGSSGGQSRVIEADSEGTRDQDRRPQRAHA